jgi:hypothetical protein
MSLDTIMSLRLPRAVVGMNHERLQILKYVTVVDYVTRPEYSQPHCSGQVCKNVEKNILITIAFPCNTSSHRVT